jgi:hypothetical protein
MLESLAGILDFDNNQRQNLGLIPQEGLLTDFTSFLINGD